MFTIGCYGDNPRGQWTGKHGKLVYIEWNAELLDVEKWIGFLVQ